MKQMKKKIMRMRKMMNKIMTKNGVNNVHDDNTCPTISDISSTASYSRAT